MNFFFRNNTTDFYKWCKSYVKYSETIVKNFEKHNSWYNYVSPDEYHEALRIQRQYTVLVASINEEENRILESIINRNDENMSDNRQYSLKQDIFEKWQVICFPKKKPRIKTIDKFLLGHKLREYRIYEGMSVAKVAGILGISEKRLYDYEEGKRLANLNVLYGLSQVYGVSIDEILNK